MNWTLTNSYLQLPSEWFTQIHPTPVKDPQLILFNEALANSLGIERGEASNSELASIFSGNKIPNNAEPIAQSYAGHQFAHFTMLGDGRAHLIGEYTTADNETYDIQLKGSGRTPYSRGGDGRAALGPMLREYIISEAMSALGIPTTRSLAVVSTGEQVIRETTLNGAILTRVAASHIRVGTFQFVLVNGSSDDLKTLADFTINRHFSELKTAKEPYVELLREVMNRQIDLIAHWLRVGFIHGVMNTDNMAISGETIDYGPCAFMDNYDPMTVFSSIDRRGRYAYMNQPAIAVWNLARFAECLLPIVDDNPDDAQAKLETVLDEFNQTFSKVWLNMMRSKLGLNEEASEDEQLVSDLLELMQCYEMDFTLTFRALISDSLPEMEAFQRSELKDWWQRWQSRLSKEEQSLESSFELMRANNPAIIPRNHKVEEALNAAERSLDFSKVHELLAALAKPYTDNHELTAFQKPPKPEERVYQTFCGT